MKGKRTECADWIKDYLKEQGADASSWEEYKVLYNRYRARCLKFKPENYEQFLATCTFAKQTKKSCGARDLGEESKPKERPFNEEKFWKDQKRDFESWKKRMQHYRDGRITNRDQTEMSEAARMKDYPPYMFRVALKCLGGTYPSECFPERLEEFREELQGLLNSTKYIKEK